jgi:hypothetical protein
MQREVGSARHVHVSVPAYFPRQITPLQRRRRAQAQRREGYDHGEVEFEAEQEADAGEREPVSRSKNEEYVMSSPPASATTASGQAREDLGTDLTKAEAIEELLNMEERRKLPSEFLRDQEQQWRDWQAVAKQKRAARMRDSTSVGPEGAAARFEVGDEDEKHHGLPCAHADAHMPNQQQQSVQHEWIDGEEAAPLHSVMARAQAASTMEDAGTAPGNVNFKSDAKGRKHQRRMQMLAKAIRVHLTSALRAGIVTKRRSDLSYLADEVRLTEVLMSSDFGHATVLWTPLSIIDPTQVAPKPPEPQPQTPNSQPSTKPPNPQPLIPNLQHPNPNPQPNHLTPNPPTPNPNPQAPEPKSLF